eukprot:5830901-Alexandrium_andersonii.AAC.1
MAEPTHRDIPTTPIQSHRKKGRRTTQYPTLWARMGPGCFHHPTRGPAKAPGPEDQDLRIAAVATVRT